MGRNIWFGTREHMQMVKAWQVGPAYGRTGSASQATYLNGGSGGRFSLGSHRTYDLAWNPSSRDDLRAISDYADGVYGDGLLYWSDPTWQDKNVLPQRWATPWLATKDGPPLLRAARPRRVTNVDMSQGYPAYGAQYKKVAGDISDTLFIPIPPGYRAHIGVHGSASAAGVVTARRFVRTIPSGGTVKPAVLGTGTRTLVNASIDGGDQAWLELSLDMSALALGATFDLYGLIVQILPTLAMPTEGRFISGQGHSGCEWSKLPAETPYSIPNDKVGMSGALVEVGSWL